MSTAESVGPGDKALGWLVRRLGLVGSEDGESDTQTVGAVVRVRLAGR